MAEQGEAEVKSTRYTVETCPPPSGVNAGLLTAVRIAKRYAHRLPTVEELRNDFGMSRATAFRWRAALRRA